MRKLICGKNSVMDAVKNGVPLKVVYILQQQEFNTKKRIKVVVISRDEMNRMTPENHQGYIAELQDFNYYDIPAMINEKPDVILVLDHIQDPQNLGAIMRTSNAFGVNYIVIPKDRAAPVNDTVLRVASGGQVGMKVVRTNSILSVVQKLKDQSYWIYATSLDKAVDVEQATFNKPLVIIMGNEHTGVSKTLLKLSDQNINIEMKGTVQSLNVSVATGIILSKI